MSDAANNPDPETRLPLECRIEAESAYQLGGPITITGTLQNSGATALWVLSWNTFLDPKWQDCVTVTRNGSLVPYVGIAVFREAPDRDSYIRLPAGGSVSRQIDLSHNYAIAEPGDYEASFYLPVMGAVDAGDPEPPADEGAYGLTIVESDKVSFRIEGVALTPPGVESGVSSDSAPSPSDTFPSQPQAPIFKNMPAQEAEKYSQAHYTAYQYILEALTSVKESIDTVQYDEWFDCKFLWGRKDGWEQRRDTVISTLTKMATWMSESRITYDKSDPEGLCSPLTLAYTYLNAKLPIYMCSRSFSDFDLRWDGFSSPEWMRNFILVHEISHAAGGTKDDQYRWPICRLLPTYNPGVAVTNAQNYALFVMKRDGDHLPTPPPLGKTISLKAANDKWLSARADGSLLADADSYDSDSTNFHVEAAGNYNVALKSIKTGKYILTDNSHSGLLTANSTSVSAAQTYEWVNQDKSLSLRSLGRDMFVSFYLNSDGSDFKDPPTPYSMTQSRSGPALFKYAVNY